MGIFSSVKGVHLREGYSDRITSRNYTGGSDGHSSLEQKEDKYLLTNQKCILRLHKKPTEKDEMLKILPKVRTSENQYLIDK